MLSINFFKNNFPICYAAFDKASISSNIFTKTFKTTALGFSESFHICLFLFNRKLLICVSLAAIRDELTITPSEIRGRPWVPFTFTCRAPTGLHPKFVIDGSGKDLSEDRRFTVSWPRENEIVASASYGLRGKSALKVWCVLLLLAKVKWTFQPIMLLD